MIIAGIDPGSRVAGYAIIRSRIAAPRIPLDYEVLDAGILRTTGGLPMVERISLLHEAVHEVLASYQVGVCVLEKAFFDKNVSTALRLGEVRGAFIAAAGRCQVSVREITPAEVKKTIVGNGRATKEQVSLSLKTLMGFDRGSLPHDASDAVAIALSYGLRLTSKWATADLASSHPHVAKTLAGSIAG